MQIDLRKLALILVLLYLVGLVIILHPHQVKKSVLPTKSYSPEDDYEYIAEHLGFLNDGKIDEKELKIVEQIYSLYKYRTTLFEEVYITNPEKFANLSQEAIQTLNIVPLALRDDMVRFLFSDAPYTLEEFSQKVELFKTQVNEFVSIYLTLPPHIRVGIENSRQIYQVKTLTDYIQLVKELRMALSGLPPDVIDAIDNMQGLFGGFEPSEISEFVSGLRQIKSEIFINTTYREWFIKNAHNFEIAEIYKTWTEFKTEHENDKKPPEMTGKVESLPSGLIEVSLGIEDNANPPKKVRILINGKEKIEILMSTESLRYADVLQFYEDWGNYTITVEAYDAKGNKNSVDVILGHYPLVFPIYFNGKAPYDFQNAKLYNKSEIEYMWRKAAHYKPLQVFEAVYPDLGFIRYHKIKLDGAMEFFYNDTKRKLLNYYKKPVPFYSMTPLHIAYFVNVYVHSFNTPIIGTLESGICGYDGETEVILMNNLFMDFNLNAWAIQIPASLSGGKLDHSEVVVIWKVPLLIGSSYKALYVLGLDPYPKVPEHIYPFESDWPKKYSRETVELMTLGLIPYRPDKFALREFYKRFGIRVTPAYPLKDLSREFITGYEFFASYINFQISEAYMQKLLKMIKNGDLRILDELNKLEAARELWYRLDGHNLYYGPKYSPDYIYIDSEGNFYYVHKNRSKAFP
ncbi:hypothetical protein [Thermococcus paralvinellae]|uniref:Uncharacterized protein n=1 Tax=Thermococcus paralvinellae TaxID=582419 RepID=W0I739_9EURY|nr:hypothetical protein [Thermococcus paralvinellae]AHF80228.1 Hypothetical protein TES1_0842 [Thermococcus paralvinellae]